MISYVVDYIQCMKLDTSDLISVSNKEKRE